MINLQNLEKCYQAGVTKTFVLRRINLEIKEGEFVTSWALGRREIDVTEHHRDAGPRLDRRVLLPGAAGA